MIKFNRAYVIFCSLNLLKWKASFDVDRVVFWTNLGLDFPFDCLGVITFGIIWLTWMNIGNQIIVMNKKNISKCVAGNLH